MGRTHCVLALLCIVMFLPGVATSMDVYWEKTFDSRGFDEGRSIAATDDNVVVGGFSRDFDDEYHLLIYNSTGNLVWRRDIDGLLWDKNLRNVALAIYNDTIILSCTDRTFLTMAYAFNGTRLWEHTWGAEYSVTDLTVDNTGLKRYENFGKSHRCRIGAITLKHLNSPGALGSS